MTSIKGLLDKCETVLSLICVLMFATMVGLGVLIVLFRFVIQSSLVFPDELMRYLFIWLVALGTAIALRRNIHAAIGMFVESLPAPLKRAALVIASVATILFFGILIDVGWSVTENAASQISPAMQISMAWVCAAVPVGAIFSLIFTLEMLAFQLTAPASRLITEDH